MKYWVYMNGAVPGSYSPQELSALPGFTPTTLVCPSEGEILEKNWRRAGEFEEVVAALQERAPQGGSAAPASPDLSISADVNAVIDTAGTRLFAHVSELMKELENRREERAQTASIQKQFSAAREELGALRDKTAGLEGKLSRLGELEDALGKEHSRGQKLEESLKAREDGMAELRLLLEKLRGEMEQAKRRFGEAQNDLAIRNRLVDKLSRDLTDKELSLAKALGLIRRLEEDLHRIVPAPVEALPPLSAEAAPVDKKPSALRETAEPSLPSLPSAPSPEGAQSALGSLLKKITTRLDS